MRSLVRTVRQVVLASVLVSPVVSSAAIVTNVNTVAELVNVLYWLKAGGKTSYQIKLAPGTYDLTDVAMTFEGADKGAHLCVVSTTIMGSTDNPRDTVLCGGGEAKGRNVIWGSFGKVRNLTISNGWNAVTGGGGYTGRYTGRQTTGIYREVISNCVLTCNYANGSWRNGGGAEYVECYDSEICYNRTGSGKNCYGGGIGSCSCYNCFIHDNESGSRGGGGGPGIYFDCVVSNNVAATDGGGIGINSGTNEFARCTIVGNRCGSLGGGAFLTTNGIIHANTLFCGNTAGSQGGGAYGGILSGCVVSNNTVVSDGNAYGGGLSYSTATNCDICYNYISPTSAKSNFLRAGGGVQGSILRDCRLFGNSIFGGGANRQGCGAYGGVLTGCSVYNNYGPDCSGVALNGGAATNCVFYDNISGSAGRFAIRQPGGPIVNCKIIGGFVESVSQPFINCTFCDQTSASYFLPAGSSAANLTNDVSGTWSGSYLFNGAYVYLKNCLICNMTGYSSIFAASKNYTVTVENCTFASNHFNTTFQNFTGSANYPHAAVVKNSIFVNNMQAGNNNQRDFWFGADSSEGHPGNNIVFTNCLVGTVRPATALTNEVGTVTTDNARFDNSEGAPPFSLRHSSLARGRGVVLDWMDGASDIRNDAEKYPRLRDGKVDIGCYQCWLDPIGSLLLLR